MKVLGIDPSSASTGMALVVDGVLTETCRWKPSRGKLPEPVRMREYFEFLDGWLGAHQGQVDLASIETLAVVRSAKTTRVMAHFECITVLACELNRLPMVRPRAGEARNVLLGCNPNIDKDAAHILVREQFPQYSWGQENQGAGDKIDAFVLAAVGPRFIGR